MSFWDRLTAIGEKAAGSVLDKQFGFMVDLARNSADTDEAIGATDVAKAAFGNAFGNYIGAPEAQKAYGAANQLVGRENANLFHDIGLPLDYEQRATSAFVRYAADNQGMSFFKHLTSGDEWRRSWNDATQATPGQTILTATGLTPDGITLAGDKASVEARRDYFENTWSGKLSSGSIDFLQNLFLDPLVLGGKYGKAGKLAEITVAPKKAEALFAASRTGEAGSKLTRVGRQQGKLDSLIQASDNMSESEIAALPQFQRSGDAGQALAALWGSANRELAGSPEEIIALRHEVKRSIVGALIGDPASIKSLSERSELLAHEAKRMADMPPQTRFVREFSWKDGGSWQYRQENLGVAPEITARQERIEQELDRVSRILSAKGSLDRVAPTAQEARRYASGQYRLHMTTIEGGGIGSRPIRVIQALSANRLPGHVNAADPMSGLQQMRDYLTAAPHLEGAAKQDILDRYVKAVGQSERRDVILQAEGAVERSTAKRYDLTPEQYDALKTAAVSRRDAWVNTLKERLYSAAPGAKFVHVVDPETDQVIAVPRPLLRSQVEDHLPVVDPRELDKFIRKGANQRLFENVVGTGVLNKVDASNEVFSEALMWGTRIWKDSVLFRLAYPIRVQVDTQMRLMSYMGALAYMRQVPQQVQEWNVLRFSRSTDVGVARALNMRLARTGLPEDMRANIVAGLTRTGGGPADLASEIGSKLLSERRASGKWGQIDPRSATDADWVQAYLRDINQQVRNSPTAMAFVKGASVDQVKAEMRKSPAMRAEWRELRTSNARDLDAWLARLEAHVEQYLPQADVRVALQQRALTLDDMKAFFQGERLDDRMIIHGESYSPLVKDNLLDRYENLRNGWYKWASDAPETVLGRSPLYSYAFKQKMKDIEARLQQTYPDRIPVKAIEDARVQADRFARREVGRTLFDSSHTSNLSSHFRFVAPFFSAWEDMMKKWGQLMYDKPQLVPRLGQVWNAPNNAGMVVDSNGNKVDAQGNVFDRATGRKLNPVKDAALIGKGEYVVIPAGFLKGATGADKVRVRKASFNIAFQGEPWWLPGLGPLVAVPMNQQVRKSFPDAADHPVLKYVFPYGLSEKDAQGQILPSWIKQARNAFGNTTDYQDTYSLILAQETSKFYAGQRKALPSTDEVAHRSRNWFILRAVTANASPVSVQPSAELQFYVDQAHIYRAKYAKDWQVKFDEDFPDFYRMRLSLSANETGIVATDAAYKTAADRRYRKLIAQAPEYGWLVVGPDNYYGSDPKNRFSQGVYTWEMTQAIGYGNTATFRSKRDNPADAIAEVEASKGWDDYQKARTALNRELERRGGISLGSKEAQDLDEVWNGYVDESGVRHDGYMDYLRKENQAWAKDFDQTDRGKAQRTLEFAAKALEQAPSLRQRGDFQVLDSYMQARQMVQALLDQSGAGLTAKANEGIKEEWDAYVAYLVSENVGFEQMYNRALLRDDLSGTVRWPTSSEAPAVP